MKINAFTFSTFSALSELVVTGLVLFVIIDNFRGHPLRWKLLFGTLAFELLVNVAYMLRQTFVVLASRTTATPVWVEVVGALHGVLSLLMFIGLIVVGVLAYRASKRQVAFFQRYKTLTAVFIALWIVSVASGEWLYWEIHLKYALNLG